MTDECQDDSRDSVSLISQSGSAESQLGRRRRSSTLLLLLFFSFFSPGFVKFLRGHVTTFNLSYSDQADLLNTGAAPSGNFMSPSCEIVTAAAAEVSQVQQNWDELPS